MLTSALPFDTISTSVRRPKLTSEVLSEPPMWSETARQDCSTAKSTVASLVSVNWLMRLVGGQDNSNSQQRLIPSCCSNRAGHEDTQLTCRRPVRWGQRSKVTRKTKADMDWLTQNIFSITLFYSGITIFLSHWGSFESEVILFTVTVVDNNQLPSHKYACTHVNTYFGTLSILMIIHLNACLLLMTELFQAVVYLVWWGNPVC